jgi:hypothetical protein
MHSMLGISFACREMLCQKTSLKLLISPVKVMF